MCRLRKCLDPSVVLVALLMMVGLTLRLILIGSGWPATNSDEATMDLMALHVAFRGETPIFFYGQYYMGALQAYIGALFLHILPASIFTVRLGMLALYPCLIVSLYALTKLLYSKPFALFVATLFTFGSGAVVSAQVFANGGYVETPLFATLIFLITARLVLAPWPEQSGGGWKRCALCACLGTVMGLALWSSMLIVPCIAASCVVLWCFRRKGVLFLLAGLILGAFPLLLFNLTAPLAKNSLVTLFTIHTWARILMQQHHIAWYQQPLGAFFVSLPIGSGYAPVCYMNELQLLHPIRSMFDFFQERDAVGCALLQGTWSTGAIVLWTLAALLACVALRTLWRKRASVEPRAEERRLLAIQALRLMLLGYAMLTLLVYVVSPVAAIAPRTTARYLEILVLAAPAVLWPLWSYIERCWFSRVRTRREIALAICSLAVLLVVAGTWAWGMVENFVGPFGIAASMQTYKQQEDLTRYLLGQGATRIFSDYWLCNRLIFHSHERIVCASIDERLRVSDDNRYPPYVTAVQAAPYPAYVVAVNKIQDLRLQQQLQTQRYRRVVLDGYAVYTYRA